MLSCKSEESFKITIIYRTPPVAACIFCAKITKVVIWGFFNMKHFLKNDSVGHYLLKIEDKVNFKHISHLVLLFLLLTLNM